MPLEVLASSTAVLGGDNDDYTRPATLPTITIPADQPTGTATVTLTPVNDRVTEADKTIVFGGQVGDGSTHAVSEATITLASEDTPSTGLTLRLTGPPSTRTSPATPTGTWRWR